MLYDNCTTRRGFMDLVPIKLEIRLLVVWLSKDVKIVQIGVQTNRMSSQSLGCWATNCFDITEPILTVRPCGKGIGFECFFIV